MSAVGWIVTVHANQVPPVVRVVHVSEERLLAVIAILETPETPAETETLRMPNIGRNLRREPGSGQIMGILPPNATILIDERRQVDNLPWGRVLQAWNGATEIQLPIATPWAMIKDAGPA